MDCLLDGDPAGQKAALRALPLALKAGMEIRFLPLAADADPDELFLEKGADALTELDKKAESAMAFAVRSMLTAPNPSAREKADVLQALFEILAQSGIGHATGGLFGGSLPVCRRRPDWRWIVTLHDFLQQRARRAAPNLTSQETVQRVITPSSQPLESANDKLTTAEFELLVLVLHYEDLAPSVAHVLEHQWIDIRTLEGRLLDRCLAAHREDAWPGSDHLDDLLETEEERHAAANLRSRPFVTDEPVQSGERVPQSHF